MQGAPWNSRAPVLCLGYSEIIIGCPGKNVRSPLERNEIMRWCSDRQCLVCYCNRFILVVCIGLSWWSRQVIQGKYNQSKCSLKLKKIPRFNGRKKHQIANCLEEPVKIGIENSILSGRYCGWTLHLFTCFVLVNDQEWTIWWGR